MSRAPDMDKLNALVGKLVGDVGAAFSGARRVAAFIVDDDLGGALYVGFGEHRLL